MIILIFSWQPFATSPWFYLLLPVIFAMGAFHGAIINWFAHKFGYTNFKMENTSHNLLYADLLMLGESALIRP